jgi:DeoR/GlpR family transcriptional regulator of sugar metabolism
MNSKVKERIKTIDMIKENPDATIPRLSELTGKSQSTISRELKEYKAAGLPRREGA